MQHCSINRRLFWCSFNEGLIIKNVFVRAINCSYIQNILVVLCLFMIPPFVKKLERCAGSNNDGHSSAAKVIGAACCIRMYFFLILHFAHCTQKNSKSAIKYSLLLTIETKCHSVLIRQDLCCAVLSGISIFRAIYRGKIFAVYNISTPLDTST